jgi:glycosyltransferase involved in cell wall biosynthesis
MMIFPAARKLTNQIRAFVASPMFDASSPSRSDPEWPRISIITPSFNQARYLERTIISIHNQMYPNLEHIVIDGGSTDNSVSILQRYSKRLTYWHSRKDEGQCDAINQGAAKATGLFMTWINSDDILLPGALDRIGRLIRENPETDLFYGNQVELDESDSVTKRVYTINFDLMDFLYEVNIIIHQQSAFWRVALFNELGGLNDCAYAMDYDLFYRMATRGMNWQRIQDFLSGFRMYPDSLTGSGEVMRSRSATVDGIFTDATGRRRTFWDRTVMRYLYKSRRFIEEPRTLIGGIENRLAGIMKGK